MSFALSPVCAFGRDSSSYEITPQRYLFEHHQELLNTEEAAVIPDETFGAKTVRSFFAEELANGSGSTLSSSGREALIFAIRQVHQTHLNALSATERESFKNFDLKRLTVLAEELTVLKLFKKPRFKAVALVDQTLDNLVYNEEARHLRLQQGGFARAKEFLKNRRPNARLVINGALFSAFVGAACYFQASQGFWVGMYLIFQEPIRDMSGALTGFMRRPLGQVAKLFDYQLFGDNEIWLQVRTDRLIRRMNSTNQKINLGNLRDNGMDFSGWNPADQRANAAIVRENWVAMQTEFEKLHPETMQWGRTVQSLMLDGESETSDYINGVQMRREQLEESQGNLLLFDAVTLANRTDLTPQERTVKKDELAAALQTIHEAHNELWKDPYLPEYEVEIRISKIHAAEEVLRDAGVSRPTLKRINELEQKRRESVRRLVMTLAKNEAILFNSPEANRNLPAGRGREGAIEMRNGYGLAMHTEEWHVMVGTILRRVGYKNNHRLDDHIAYQRTSVCRAAYTSALLQAVH